MSAIKLDIGSGDPSVGENQADGYIKQDIAPYPGIDIVCDIRELDKFVADSSCEKIRASHVLEHFSLSEIDGLLGLLFRLLKDGGELEIIVPNFKWHAEILLQGMEDDAVRYAFGGQLDEWDYHKNGFTPNRLRNYLAKAGFTVITLLDESSITCIAKKPLKPTTRSKKRISVLTPTIRVEGLELVKKSLENQTFTDFEWIIGAPFKPEFDCVWVEDNFKDGLQSEGRKVHTLNKVYNAMMRQATGDLIISWQDWIWAPPDTLEKFWNLYQAIPNSMVAAIGDQYSEFDENGMPKHAIWIDPRRKLYEDSGDSFHKTGYMEWEESLASAPRKMFFDIGGHDEWLDDGAGCDNVSVAERAMDNGYQVYMCHTIEYKAYAHKKDAMYFTKNQNLYGRYDQRRRELKRLGLWKKLPYLV